MAVRNDQIDNHVGGLDPDALVGRFLLRQHLWKPQPGAHCRPAKYLGQFSVTQHLICLRRFSRLKFCGLCEYVVLLPVSSAK
jgi:hypothetical protein